MEPREQKEEPVFVGLKQREQILFFFFFLNVFLNEKQIKCATQTTKSEWVRFLVW